MLYSRLASVGIIKAFKHNFVSTKTFAKNIKIKNHYLLISEAKRQHFDICSAPEHSGNVVESSDNKPVLSIKDGEIDETILIEFEGIYN